MNKLCQILAVLSLIISNPNVAKADQPKRPNIIFIYADDHAQHAISAYGSVINKTPHIDALAAQGMRFTQSFVANSICGPARATILTGLHSHANGKMTNRKGFNNDLPTYTKVLRDAGYQSIVVGKWHIRSKPQGFDYWDIVGNGSYYNMNFQSNLGKNKTPGYTTEVITNKALNWIKNKRDKNKPFIAWVSHTAAHRSWFPAQEKLTKYDDQKIPEPSTLFDDYTGRTQGMRNTQMRISKDLFPAYDLKLPITGKGILDGGAKRKMSSMNSQERLNWDKAYGPKNQAFLKANLKGKALVQWKYQRYIKDYLRCVSSVDDSVGQITKFLKDNNLDENTIVIYSADQGFFLGDHGWYDKRWMYEHALRTPLIVKWPGVTKPGSVNHQMVQNIDMAPTFIDAAIGKTIEGMQGKSLKPLLQGKTPKDWRNEIYYHYQEAGKSRTQHNVAKHYGIRTNRYKLIYIYEHNEWEMYDLQSDPDEMHNLYNDSAHTQTITKLKTRLKALRAKLADKSGKNMP